MLKKKLIELSIRLAPELCYNCGLYGGVDRNDDKPHFVGVLVLTNAKQQFKAGNIGFNANVGSNNLIARMKKNKDAIWLKRSKEMSDQMKKRMEQHKKHCDDKKRKIEQKIDEVLSKVTTGILSIFICRELTVSYIQTSSRDLLLMEAWNS